MRIPRLYPACGQMLIQHPVEFFFCQVLLMWQQSGKQASPLLCDSQLSHQGHREVIAPEDRISTSLKHPKHAHPIFGRQRTVSRVERIGQDMAVLILPIDPRPRAVKMVPGRTL